jgi:hypothetical protein
MTKIDALFGMQVKNPPQSILFSSFCTAGFGWRNGSGVF